MCFRETHSFRRASKIYGHKASQITHTPLLSTVAAQHYSTPHTLWGSAVELASALTTATILADAAVATTVSEMTYHVSSGTLNHTQPTSTGAIAQLAPAGLVHTQKPRGKRGVLPAR